MEPLKKDHELQKKLAALVLRGLEHVRPFLSHITDFRDPEVFYQRRFKKDGIIAYGIEFVVRTELIASSIVSGERIFGISFLRETPEIEKRIRSAGRDRASFSRQILLTQSGHLLESYVQYLNLGLRDETSGLMTINATHLKVTRVNVETFDWTEPTHFGKDPSVAGMQTFFNLEKIVAHCS